MVKAYVNIKLPEELAEEVDKLVKDRTLGYRSRANSSLKPHAHFS